MMKAVLGAAAAIILSGAPALAMLDDVQTPVSRVYVDDGDATIRFSDEGSFYPDGNGGQAASGGGYLSVDLGICTAHVEISWQIQVDSDGNATTQIDTTENDCARVDSALELMDFDASSCTNGWDSLQPGESGTVCWAGVNLTRE